MDSEDNSDDHQDEGRTPADMVSSFLLHAPPGEFPEVLDDVKGIVRDDRLIEEQVSKVLPKYTKSQLTPVKLDSSEHAVILSKFNDIGNGRFVDPRTKKSFQYNHMTGAISDPNDWQPEANAESWRSALEQEWTSYTTEHYHEGAGSVFSSYKDDVVILNACLEGHQFQPKKFWNGRWRSVWTITFNPAKDKQLELVGIIKLHVHYYEDGNVQLVSSRHCDQKITLLKPDQIAKDVVEAVKKLESDYQRAISENYKTMSDTTFKAIRRPLPVIGSKIEWNKMMGYKIGSELKQQMDESEHVTDGRGEILISYLDSPNFIKASTNAVRLVSKLKVAVQKQELYETHQILRTIYFRFINIKDKIESLVGLLYYGAQYLLDNLETISGQDIALLFLEASSKYLQNRIADSTNIGSESWKLNMAQSNPSYHLVNKTLDIDICQKISNLAIKLPDNEMGQAKFTAEALKLLHPKILNRDLLHTVIAGRYWQEKNYVNARYHYLHCASLDNAHDIALLLVEYHTKSANKGEIDLFITQFIFQFLCLQNPLDSTRISSRNQTTRQNSNNASSLATVSRKSRNTIKLIAEKIFSTYTLKHPQLSHVEVPFSSLPLLNFTYFIISILDSNEIDSFKMLCDIYKATWSRDPNYQSYLNRIGVLYFGQSDQNKQHQQQGGFFNNILMSLLEGADEDDEGDSNLDGNNSSSSDELD